MRIAGREKLEKFMRKHANSRASMQAWITEAQQSSWKTPQEIKERYRSADILTGNRIVFNIGGNNYRLVVLARYVEGQLLILKIGTHSEYSKWVLE